MGGQKYEIVCWRREREGEMAKKIPHWRIFFIHYRPNVFLKEYNLYHSISNS
jgi:hypothetical protein